MATVNIQIKGLNKLRGAFLKAPKAVSSELEKGIKRSVIKLERKAKQEVPVDTGRLRGSHRTKFGNLRGEVSPTTTYAVYVHEGTRHQRSNPWLQRTADALQKDVEQEVQQAVNRAIKKAFG